MTNIWCNRRQAPIVIIRVTFIFAPSRRIALLHAIYWIIPMHAPTFFQTAGVYYESEYKGPLYTQPDNKIKYFLIANAILFCEERLRRRGMEVEGSLCARLYRSRSSYLVSRGSGSHKTDIDVHGAIDTATRLCVPFAVKPTSAGTRGTRTVDVVLILTLCFLQFDMSSFIFLLRTDIENRNAKS